MELIPANIDALRVSFEVLYRTGFEAVEPWYKQIFTDSTSGSPTKRFALPARLRSLREWVGDRQVENLVRYTSDIKAKKFELTAAVDVETVEDDTFDLYQPDMQQIGAEAADHPNVLAVDFMRNGNDATRFVTYDGKAFWHATHLINASKKDVTANRYANYRAAAFALTGPNFETIRAEMKARKADNGRPMRLGRKLVLVVPPQLEAQARRILFNDYVASAAGTATESNPNKGTAELVVVPDLVDDATTWYVFEVGWIVRAGVFVVRVPGRFVLLASPNDAPVWTRDKIEFGVRQRDNFGPLLPQLGYKCVG